MAPCSLPCYAAEAGCTVCLAGGFGSSVPCARDLSVQRRLLACTRTHPFRLIARCFYSALFLGFASTSALLCWTLPD